MTCSIRVENTTTGVEKTICLRGAFLTDNKTAQCEAEGIRDRVFGYGRGLLEGWRAKFVSMFGPDEKCTIPDPNDYRLARLHDGSSIMSDGCNQARHMQSVMKDFIQQDYIKQLGGSEADNFAEGKAKWEAMSEAEQNESVRVYIVTCQNYLPAEHVATVLSSRRSFGGGT